MMKVKKQTKWCIEFTAITIWLLVSDNFVSFLKGATNKHW